MVTPLVLVFRVLSEAEASLKVRFHHKVFATLRRLSGWVASKGQLCTCGSILDEEFILPKPTIAEYL